MESITRSTDRQYPSQLRHPSGIHTPVERIGWPDEFIEHGKPETLRELHGLTAEAATEKVLKHFS
ncbi:MAG: hypothetical protein ACRDBP_16510 [Luteolibacter sp.]